jgi:hypothetical protein
MSFLEHDRLQLTLLLGNISGRPSAFHNMREDRLSRIINRAQDHSLFKLSDLSGKYRLIFESEVVL